MARNLYSRPFIVHQGLSGRGTSVLVPEGHVYVVKQLTLYANVLLGTARARFVNDDSGATLFAAGVQAGTPGWFGFYGALCFEPGSSFHWESDVEITEAVDVYAGGYDLLAP